LTVKKQFNPEKDSEEDSFITTLLTIALKIIFFTLCFFFWLNLTKTDIFIYNVLFNFYLLKNTIYIVVFMSICDDLEKELNQIGNNVDNR